MNSSKILLEISVAVSLRMSSAIFLKISQANIIKVFGEFLWKIFWNFFQNSSRTFLWKISSFFEESFSNSISNFSGIVFEKPFGNFLKFLLEILSKILPAAYSLRGPSEIILWILMETFEIYSTLVLKFLWRFSYRLVTEKLREHRFLLRRSDLILKKLTC